MKDYKNYTAEQKEFITYYVLPDAVALLIVFAVLMGYLIL